MIKSIRKAATKALDNEELIRKIITNSNLVKNDKLDAQKVIKKSIPRMT